VIPIRNSKKNSDFVGRTETFVAYSEPSTVAQAHHVTL
jgi:hypothetical protein